MRAFIVTALTAAAALPALGQSAADIGAQTSPAALSRAGDARLNAPIDVSLLPIGLTAQEPARVEPVARRSGGVLRPVLPVAVGAVLGGWIGYVASQIARSDWDKESNGEFASYRLSFTAGGAAIGAITGGLLGNKLGSGHGNTRTPRVMRASSAVITTEEIAGSHATSALDLIRKLRPRWLQTRGTNSFGESATGTASEEGVSITPGDSPLKIYIDNTLMGNPSVLSNIPVNFAEVRYFDTAAATFRWGAGHEQGAIEIITGSAAPQE